MEQAHSQADNAGTFPSFNSSNLDVTEGTMSSREPGIARASVPTQATDFSLHLLCPKWWCNHEWVVLIPIPVSGLISLLFSAWAQCWALSNSQASFRLQLIYFSSGVLRPFRPNGFSSIRMRGYLLPHLPIDAFQSQILGSYYLLREKVLCFCLFIFALDEYFWLWALIIIWKILIDVTNSLKTTVLEWVSLQALPPLPPPPPVFCCNSQELFLRKSTCILTLQHLG